VWTDSHCHVPYDDVGEGVIDEARAVGVGRIITVGTDAARSQAGIDVARRHDGVWATVGLHPHEASIGADSLLRFLPLLEARDPKVVAVGECGLDYYYDHAPRQRQREAFAAQIALARAHRVALVVHSRDAWDDTFDILKAEGVPERTVLHCFTGGPAEARRALDLGAWLSFSGIVTFKTAPEVRDAAALCPLDRVLVETDSPFLAPVPLRGRPNRPENVPLVGAAVAAAKALGVEEIEAVTTANAAIVFGLEPPEPA
jgi:TatD DNase family protein